MTETRIDPATVTGWGVDADPENDPTYPYRDRSKDDGLAMDWQRPPLQEPGVEILRSNEHNRLPAVVGTSTPPTAVSGMIRRFAFRYSENDLRHWMLLLGADRVNMVEGIVQDLGRGRIPNIPAEMGMRAEWKHNRKGLIAKIAIGAALTGALVAFTRRGRKDQEERVVPITRR